MNESELSRISRQIVSDIFANVGYRGTKEDWETSPSVVKRWLDLVVDDIRQFSVESSPAPVVDKDDQEGDLK